MFEKKRGEEGKGRAGGEEEKEGEGDCLNADEEKLGKLTYTCGCSS